MSDVGPPANELNVELQSVQSMCRDETIKHNDMIDEMIDFVRQQEKIINKKLNDQNILIRINK